MRDLLARLDRWLKHHAPAIHDGLGPGLAAHAIDLYEKDIGRPFTPGLRALNDWAYGMLPDKTGAVVGRYALIKLNAGTKDMRDDVLRVFGDVVEHIGWHVPTGRVIAVRGDERTVIAPDFDTFLTAYVESLEAGMWTYVDGLLEDHGAFATALAARFPPTPFVPPPPTPAPPPPPAPLPYSPSTTFVVGNRVSHPSFGTGTVRSVNATKVEIDFAAGTKTLVHARR